MERKKGIFITYIGIGFVGIILILLGLRNILNGVGDKNSATLLTVSGIILVVSYVYFLEEKSGITKKVIWIKAISIIAIGLYFFRNLF